MKKCSVLLILLIFTLVSCGNQNKKQTNYSLIQAEWLIGTWQVGSSEEEENYEVWTKTNGNEFVGKNFKIRELDTTILENLLIKQVQDSIFYIATVIGHNNDLSIFFPLKFISDNEIVFENLKHDFPQKITYSKIDSNLMIAEISGNIHRKKEIYRFSMLKIE